MCHLQVLSAHSEWKRPCVALYTIDDLSSKLSELPLDPVLPVATAADLTDDFSLAVSASRLPADDRSSIATCLSWDRHLIALDCPYHYLWLPSIL